MKNHQGLVDTLETALHSVLSQQDFEQLAREIASVDKRAGELGADLDAHKTATEGQFASAADAVDGRLKELSASTDSRFAAVERDVDVLQTESATKEHVANVRLNISAEMKGLEGKLKEEVTYATRTQARDDFRRLVIGVRDAVGAIESRVLKRLKEGGVGEEEMQQLQERLDQLDGGQASLQAKIDAVTGGLETMQREAQATNDGEEAASGIALLRAELHELQSTRQGLEAKITAVQESVEERLGRMEGERAAYAMSADLEELKSMISTADFSKTEVLDTINSVESRVFGNHMESAEFRELRDRVARLDASRERVQSSIENINTKVDTNLEESGKLEKAIVELRTRVDQLDESRRNLQEAIQDIKSDQENFQMDGGNAREAIQNIRGETMQRFQTMQNEIDSRLSQMQRLRPSATNAPEIETLQTRASELEIEAQRLQKHFEEEVLKLKMIQEGQKGKLVEMVDRLRDETHILLNQAEEAVDERFRLQRVSALQMKFPGLVIRSPTGSKTRTRLDISELRGKKINGDGSDGVDGDGVEPAPQLS